MTPFTFIEMVIEGCLVFTEHSPSIEFGCSFLLPLPYHFYFIAVFPLVFLFHQPQETLFPWKIAAEGTLVEAVSFLSTYVTEQFCYLLCSYEDPLFFKFGSIALYELI